MLNFINIIIFFFCLTKIIIFIATGYPVQNQQMRVIPTLADNILRNRQTINMTYVRFETSVDQY